MKFSIFKFLCLALLSIAPVHIIYAQTASILPPAKTTFLDNNGKPLVGGKIDFYIPGTTTRKTTWQDAGQSVPNANPVVLDAAGRAIILGDGSYRQRVTDKYGNLIWDQVTSSTGSGGGGSSATVGDGDAVGTIKAWSGLIAPNQYVFAYGQEFARASYPELFQAITYQSNVNCTSGSPTLTGIGDTSQLSVGSHIETSCLNAGATIVSKTISTVVASSNAIISTTTSVRFFPYGNGDGTNTFQLPDLRGRIIAGRDNMGGIAANRLTSTYFGASASGLGASGGNQSNALIAGNLPPYTPSGTVSNGAITTTLGGSYVVGSTSGGVQGGSSFPTSVVGVGSISASSSQAASTFTGIASGGTSDPFGVIQPTQIYNYIIKIVPDSNPNSFFGVASIGGMYGVIECGFGLTCAGNTISSINSVVPAPTTTTLGGVYEQTAPANQFVTGVDNAGNFSFAGGITTINGQPCILGASCTIVAAADIPIFATVAIADAYAPAIAPDYIQTQFYDTAQIADGGALYKKNGSTSGDITITLSDGVTHVGYDIATTRISASSYGLNPSASASVNLAAIKSAIARTSVGGTAYVPYGNYTVDTSGGLSNAAVINKSMKFEVDGILTASFIAQQANPPYIIKITSDDVEFFGHGTFAGNGTTYLDPAGGSDAIYPGLIYVNANRFKYSGITISEPPQKGIFIVNSYDAQLHDFNIIGGPNNYVPSTYVDPTQPNYGNTNPGYLGSYNVGITLSGGGRHNIKGVNITPDGSGGVVSIGIFNAGDNGSSNNLVITNNIADGVWEKLAYLYGTGQIVSNNQILGCYNGTYQTCAYTDAIRFFASNSIASNNYAQNVNGFIQVLDSTDNKVIGNRINGTVGVAINVQELNSGSTVNNNQVIDNSVTFQSGFLVPNTGIELVSQTSAYGNQIQDNNISGYAATAGAILISGGSTGASSLNITGNNIKDYYNGINLISSSSFNIQGNNFRTGTSVAINIQASNTGSISNNVGISQPTGVSLSSGSSNLSVTDNKWYSSTNIGIVGYGSSSNINIHGNQYSTAALQGSASLSGASGTTTVSNGGVAPEAIILLSPGNNAAALKFAADGYYATPNSTNFDIVNGNGNVASGSTMNYQIIQ